MERFNKNFPIEIVVMKSESTAIEKTKPSKAGGFAQMYQRKPTMGMSIIGSMGSSLRR